MDIKSKNTNKTIFNYIIFILLLGFISTGILSTVGISKIYKQQFNSNIYSNSLVSSEIDDFIGMTLDYAIYYKNDDYVENINNITQYEIENYKNTVNQKIEEEYESEREKVEDKYYSYEDYDEVDSDKLQEELQKLRKKIEEKYSYSDETILQNIIEAKRIAYENLKLQINSYNNIKFAAYDNINKIWIGEGEIDSEKLIKSSRYFSKRIVTSANGVEEHVFIKGKETNDEEITNRIQRLDSGYYTSGNYVSSYIQEQSPQYYYTTNYNIDLYIWIPNAIQKGDKIYTAFAKINSGKNTLVLDLVVLAVSVVGALGLNHLRKRQNQVLCGVGKLINKIKKYPIEYKIGALILTWIIYRTFAYRAYNYDYYSEYYDVYSNMTINNILYTMLLIFIFYVISKAMFENYNEDTLFENNITKELIEVINETMGRGSVMKKILRAAILYIVAAIVLLVIAMVSYGTLFVPCFIIGIIMTIALAGTAIKKMIYLDRIMVGARDAAEGKLNYKIAEKGKGQLCELAHNINNIKDGLKKSLSNEMKSEKMKSELITNVSHDLKTPLTSIINYINLLKMEDIKPESARDYIAVLDNKSQRLKVLIEDLFEASKAASGEMKLNIEKIEIVQLLQQILGEFNEKLLESGLDLKANIPNEKIYIQGDGRRLFRVFENLISNISKYALSNTRVYVDVIDNDEEVIITMKNISSYELNFDADEITNRFKRGDQARTTEGSGLGLAIAKSIVELHGGSLTIEIDGDLFKSIIKLKK